jgi:RND family efflux transporter MFP subunit
MNRNRLPIILLFLGLAAALEGCSKEEPVVEEIRSIKTITVGAEAGQRQAIFSGIVRAAESSSLSFEVGGIVDQVSVDIGDRVDKGDILAVLDREPYELEVKKAAADLERARANLTNKRADYEREKAIFEQGAGSKRLLDQAKFGFAEAEAGVSYAVSKLNLAQRDLRKTDLHAPYDGSIGVRLIDPHVYVQPGQKVFEIDGAGAMEVQLDIPETVVNLLAINDGATVTFTTVPGKTFQSTISEIGSLAGAANAYPVKVALNDPPAGIQSGMTAEVTLRLQSKDWKSGYLVPPQALVPSKVPARAHLFVYDPASSTVRKVPVHLAGAQDNQAIISEGVSAGEVVAVAGVSFLSDGQKVRLMQQPEKEKPEEIQLQ